MSRRLQLTFFLQDIEKTFLRRPFRQLRHHPKVVLTVCQEILPWTGFEHETSGASLLDTTTELRMADGGSPLGLGNLGIVEMYLLVSELVNV